MRISGSAFLSAAIMVSTAASAQDVREAYNLSNMTVQGTARSIGFGGALGSVGGDFSSISVNPAGLGIYRSSELSFTPALKLNGAESDYAGSSVSDNCTRFGISQFGMVFTSAPRGKRYDRSNWKAVSFAFGMNRLADFNRNYTYEGKNTTSSFSQVFEADANQYPNDVHSTDANNFPGYIGYQSYLLNSDPSSSTTFHTVVPFAGGIMQSKHVEERGSMNEYVFAIGGNYKEKLMLGFTLDIPAFHYHRSSAFIETVAPGNMYNPERFTSLDFGQNLDITGTGINGKFGAIYKFSNYIRAGIAIHTPTYFAITDEYDPSMISVVNNTQYYKNTSYTGGLAHNSFDYHFTTPWRTVLSVTGLLPDRGFITADYEYVNYSAPRYHFNSGYYYTSGPNFQDEENILNQQIKSTYKGTSNFRIGAEYRVAKEFMVRAGFGYYGDPYSSEGKASVLSYTTERIDLSIGVGYHSRHFFTDLGFMRSMYHEYDQPYSVDYSQVVSGSAAVIPVASIDHGINNVAWTFGLKF